MRYENGTRDQVLTKMLDRAIQDREALMDAYKPRFGEPGTDATKEIERCLSEIRDFRKLTKGLRAVTRR